MSVNFNMNIAQALVQGQAIPVPFVQQFVQDAYDSFAQLQSLSDRLKDKENECSSLTEEIERLKALSEEER